MKQVNDHIDDLIIQLLCGELDGAELAELRTWIASSPENEKYFLQKQEVWFSAVDTAQWQKYNKEEAFKDFQRRVAQAEDVEEKSMVQHAPWRKWLSYAAVIIVVVAMTFWGYHRGEHHVKNSFADIQVEAPYGSRTKALLPDGTVVWLNSGSKLSYSQGYGLGDRKVSIKGEGYFEVKHNEKLPFSVNSQTIRVNVLGTKFNFRDYPDDTEAEVVLEKGSVKLDNLLKRSKSQMMVPGQKVVLDKKTGQMTTESCDASGASQWAEGIIAFKDATLSEIAKRIERSYNVKVLLSGKDIGKYRFNGDFVRQEQSLQEVLETLSATGKLHYKQQGKTVVIY